MTAQRTQLQADDVKEPERLRRVLNDFMLDQSSRLEALEAVSGLTLLPLLSFDTGGTLAPTSPPFSLSAGGLRLTCPFSPSGLILLRLESVAPSGQPISSLASDVKWHFAAGPGVGAGVLHVDFITGLAINSSYRALLGATRA